MKSALCDKVSSHFSRFPLPCDTQYKGRCCRIIWDSTKGTYDGLGSVMRLTDAQGVVTDSYEYADFGKQTLKEGTTGNVYRYTGQQLDGDSGLYYLRARYYDPETGRFLTKEMEEGDKNEPTTFHPYSYFNNNPINFIDPSGYWKWKIDDGKAFLVPEEGDTIEDLKQSGFPTAEIAKHYKDGETGKAFDVTAFLNRGRANGSLGQSQMGCNCAGLAYTWFLNWDNRPAPGTWRVSDVRSDLRNKGYSVKKYVQQDLKYGDLVYFSGSNGPHMGIFLTGTSEEDSWILNQLGTNGEVTITKLSNIKRDYGQPFEYFRVQKEKINTR